MNRVLFGVIAILTACGIAMGYALKAEYQKNGRLREQVSVTTEALERARSAQKRADRALVLRERARAAAAREQALLRQRLEDALTTHRQWAEQPVPQEVQDALL